MFRLLKILLNQSLITLNNLPNFDNILYKFIENYEIPVPGNRN